MTRRRSKKTGRYIRSKRSSSPTRKTRRRGLSAKKLRAIKTYANKGYSANRIQKKMRQRHMGVRRKTVLRIVRETKGKAPRPHPEKHIPHKYGRPTHVSYPLLGQKQVTLIGYHHGEKVRRNRRGSGRQLFQFVREEMDGGFWDSRPSVMS